MDLLPLNVVVSMYMSYKVHELGVRLVGHEMYIMDNSRIVTLVLLEGRLVLLVQVLVLQLVLVVEVVL